MDSKITTELKLTRKIWDPEATKTIIGRALVESADDLENLLRDNIDNSTPAGRFYTKRLITERKTKANNYLRAKRCTSTRVVVEREIYQASAQGQPPARRFSILYRSLKVKRVAGKLAIIATVKAKGVYYLDSPFYLDRPFFAEVIEKFYQEQFVEGVRNKIEELIAQRNYE